MYESFDKISCVKYYHNFVTIENVFEKLLSEITFNSDEESSIMIYGKKLVIPRKQTAFGEKGTSYRFSGNTLIPKTFDECKTLSVIKEELERKTNLSFNFCLVNYYATGKDYIGYHSDDEKDLDSNYPIASLSFGQTRPFRFKHKLSGIVYEQELENNSLVLMYSPCQSKYKHSVPKTMKKLSGRINLTFRKIKFEYL